jgi:uncharacterized protein
MKKNQNGQTGMSRELRFLPFEDWEVRETKDGPILEGYASVFNTEAVIFNAWREMVAPGAYKKTIQENDIRSVWNHNTDLVLGRNKAKTLELREDDIGLKVKIFPPDTQAGRDAVTSIKRGDVTQMSIAFRVIKQDRQEDEDERLPLRIIREAKLFEVSPVTFPAFEATSIQARSGLDEPIEEALQLIQAAQIGLTLSAEEREIIAEARDVFEQYLIEPEQERHHSEEEAEPEEAHSVQDGEPDVSHSSDFDKEFIRLERRLLDVDQLLTDLTGA